MEFGDISLWYYVLALLLSGGALGVFALIDRRTLRQTLLTMGWVAAALVVVVLIAWNGGRLSRRTALAPIVVLVFAAYAYRAVRWGMLTYRRSRMRTREHYEYLLGNGATRFEAVLPSVRRALRASLIGVLQNWSKPVTSVPLLMLVAMLMGGAQPSAAFVTTVLFVLAFLGTVVLATAVAIWIIEH